MNKDGFVYGKENINEKDIFLDKEFIFHIKTNFSLGEMYQSLLRLDTLKKINDGWDGNNGLSMKNETYENTLKFIRSRIVGGYGMFLNEKGEIVIDYFKEDSMKDIGIEIGENIWRIYDYSNDKEDVFNNSVSFLGRVSWLARRK